MHKLLMVGLRWVDTPQNPEMIDGLLSTKGDWVRWNGWTWFVYTTMSTAEIRMTLMTRLTVNDSIIIAEVAKSAIDGWAPKWVWDWMNTKINPPTGTLPNY